MTEAESWREQQLQLEEQLVSQTRAKEGAEVEVERCKQVMDFERCFLVAVMLNARLCFPETSVWFKPQEIQYLEEEHHRAKTTLQSRVKDREDEIQKLRNQVSYCFIKV